MEIDMKCINTVRCLISDVVEKANSGHVGGGMGCSPMAHVLWSKVMNYNPQDPDWINRDRFILSNGHICAMLYSFLHLTGYNISIEDLKNFRQYGSKTPGHPERHVTPGVEVCTGPLGQGFANGVGMAIAEKHMAAMFNSEDYQIIDHYTYVICGDGCIQEGITNEAISLAGNLKLNKLIVFFDNNSITLDGDLSMSSCDDVLKRFELSGWYCQEVSDGDTNIQSISDAIDKAKLSQDRPNFISIKTTIGYGSDKQGKSSCHGGPLGKEQVEKLKIKFGLDPTKSFNIENDVYEFYNKSVLRCKNNYTKWKETENNYRLKYPENHRELIRRVEGKTILNFDEIFTNIYNDFNTKIIEIKKKNEKISTRTSSSKILNMISNYIPELIGGTADLSSSTLAKLTSSKQFTSINPNGKNIYFGIREHSMSAISNGISCHGGLIPFCSTFFCFIQYMISSVRLSSLNKCKVIYILTHDSIGVGEDGPTHQPIEQLSQCRSIPGVITIRPADEKETIGAYKYALQYNGPTVLVLSRQNLPQLEGTHYEGIFKGAYIVHETHPNTTPDVIIISTGSEVHLSINSIPHFKTKDIKIRIISMPSTNIFDMQDKEYKNTLFPKNVPCISIEAASSYGWSKYSQYQIGIDEFGMSAQAEKIFEYFGLTPEKIASQIEEYLSTKIEG